MLTSDARDLYTFCMVVATLVAAWLIRRQQRELAIDKAQKLAIAIGGLIGATTGS